MQKMRSIVLAFLVASVRCYVPAALPGASARRSAVTMGAAQDGIFTPLVKLTKNIVGKERFLPFRAKVIAEHTKVIQAFVETSDSPMGCMALKKLFELADVDGSGAVDREELKAALLKLGFDHLGDKQIDAILARADADDNCVIDYDEFVAEAPKTLKVNLVKLAKSNGSKLGFLS